MNHAQSNRSFKPKKDPHLKVPQTKAEFQKLGYMARVQLQEEHPEVYKAFTTPKKPWE